MPSARGDRPPPRRVKLEERLAWLERHVAEQDKVMLALHDELARLRAELKLLRERPAAGAASEPPDPAERPPHY
ncbi:MAG TPA: SlyX family protein [Opitutaceae bacterium]|nr:SlyX family protein [Opitutaceae bacterium]